MMEEFKFAHADMFEEMLTKKVEKLKSTIETYKQEKVLNQNIENESEEQMKEFVDIFNLGRVDK